MMDFLLLPKMVSKYNWSIANLRDYLYYMFTVGIQIHFTGQAHWIASAYMGGQVRLYDSYVGTSLTKSLKTQLKKYIVEWLRTMVL